MDEINVLKQILCGRARDISLDTAKNIRIFMSSTFSDTHAERDYLIENIYPKLKTYCKKEYGLDFQVIDMRWGISSKSELDHSATRICLSEVKNCQNYSKGPCFIAFLSHRYGNRVLPYEIHEDEFDILKNEMLSVPDLKLDFEYNHNNSNFKYYNENIVEKCYSIDRNEIPVKYKLKSIDEIFTDFFSDKNLYMKIWKKMEQQLLKLLYRASSNCFKKNLITEAQKNDYLTSVTEHEIYEGILTAKAVNENALCFIREIEDVYERFKENDPQISKYIDLKEDKTIDEESMALLNDLKSNKIKNALSDNNLIKFQVKFDDLLGKNQENLKIYLKNFGVIFYEKVKELIDINARKTTILQTLTDHEQNLFNEVLAHAKFSAEYVLKFYGRVELLNRMENYLLSESTTPFIAHGGSGCGKTSLIAKLIEQTVFENVPNSENWITIARFLGTTPQTSSIIKAFHSILYQLEKIMDFKALPKTFEKITDLKNELIKRLKYFSMNFPEKKLFILIDSIDQLVATDYDLTWFINCHPKNVKMIFSTISRHGGILNSLKHNYIPNDESYMEITCLDISIAHTILEQWLMKDNRSLTEAQWLIIDEMLSKATLYPLYIKILFDIVNMWSSYFMPDEDFTNCLSIEEMIKFLFKIWEEKYGSFIFARIMFYFSSLSNGISETELEDILSLDDELLYQIFEFHAPPLRRFPFGLWTRIKDSLKEYIVEKEVHDSRVIFWYHRKFIEYASDQYFNVSFYSVLKDLDNRDKLLMNIIDYYKATWKDQPKPYKLNEYVAKKKNIPIEQAAPRYTSEMPYVFSSTDGKKRYNKRLLNELPYVISKLKPSEAVLNACKFFYFDHDLMVNYLSANGGEALKETMTLFSNHFPGLSRDQEIYKHIKEIQVLSLTFFMCMYTISYFPDTFGAQMTMRLMRFYDYLPHIRKLIDDFDQNSPKICALIVPYQHLASIGNGEIYTFDRHINPIKCTSIVEDFMFTLSDKVNVFGILKLETVGEINFPVKDSYNAIKVYLKQRVLSKRPSISEFNGGFLLSSESRVINILFNETVLFTLHFDKLVIDEVFMLSTEIFLISFKNSKFIELYKMSNGELITRKSFESKIQFTLCNLKKMYSFYYAELDCSKIYVCLIFENTEVKCFKLMKNGTKSQLDLILSFPPAGIKIKSCEFLNGQGKTFFNSLVISYEDGGFAYADFYDDEKSEPCYSYMRPVFNDCPNELLTFKPVNYKKNGILLLGSDHKLYLWKLNAETLIQIDGNYDNGVYDGYDVVGVSQGIISVMRPPKKHTENGSELVEVAKIPLHFDKINFFEYEASMTVSASEDTTFKVTDTKSHIGNNDLHFEYDISESKINQIIKINDELVLALLQDTKKVDIWSVTEGKIVGSVASDIASIEQTIAFDDFIVFLGIEKVDEELNFAMKAFIKNNQLQNTKNVEYHQICFKEYKNSFNCTLFQNRSQIYVVYETISEGKPSILIDVYAYDKETDSMVIVKEYPNQLNSDSTSQNKTFNETSCGLTLLSNLFYYIQDENIFYKDLNKSQIIASTSISYQSNKENSIKSIHTIEKTDDLVIVAENMIVYINLLNKNEIQKFMKSNIFVTDIKINEKLICFFDKSNQEMQLHKIDDIKHSKSFNNPIFKYTSEILQSFTLTPEGNYVAYYEYPKFLSLVRLSDSKRIAYLPLYSGINDIISTNEFLCLAMKDRRVFTLLIVDPLEPEHFKRIKKLPSRNSSKNEEEEMKISTLIKNIISGLTGYTIINTKKENEEKSKFTLAKIFHLINYIGINIFSKDSRGQKSLDLFKCEASENNWLVKIHKKNNFLSESQVNEIIQKRKYTVNRETLRIIFKAQKQKIGESNEKQNEKTIKTFEKCAEEVILNFKNTSIKTSSKMCIIS